MDQDLSVFLDNPKSIPDTDWVEVRGWIAGNQAVEDLSIQLTSHQKFANEARPDVAAAFPDKAHVRGFRQRIQSKHLQNGLIQLTGNIQGSPWKHEIPLQATTEHTQAEKPAASPAQAKDDTTYSRIRPILALPGGDAPEDASILDQTWTGQRFCFLSDKEAQELLADDLDRVSAHLYPKDLQKYLTDNPDILALDCGAGLRKQSFPQVVHLEPIAYPSTHVQAMAEKLPFRDNSFDLVFCLSVLEHLRDPFAAAKEMLRVLKPGGRIFLEVPFLIQVHGYPEHYYNMTPQGLSNLVDQQCTIIDQCVPYYGHPIHALTPLIKTWHDGLPEDAQKDFRSMTIAELMDKPDEYMHLNWTQKLPEEVQANIAALTRLEAIKN